MDITIGWTIHPRDREGIDYMPFMDTWRPGQPQHTETITVDLPDITEHPVNLSGQDIADQVFHATNAPFVTADSIAGRIAAAIEATGYHGQGAHYSLSVGDTVTVQGVTYACASMGWEVVAEPLSLARWLDHDPELCLMAVTFASDYQSIENFGPLTEDNDQALGERFLAGVPDANTREPVTPAQLGAWLRQAVAPTDDEVADTTEFHYVVTLRAEDEDDARATVEAMVAWSRTRQTPGVTHGNPPELAGIDGEVTFTGWDA